MTTLYLLRHGEVYDPDNIFYGRLPGYGLSDQGKKMIEYLGQNLRSYSISALYHSPLLRTEQSAAIIGNILGLNSIPDERLLEIATHFEGKPRSHMMQYPPLPDDYAESMEGIYVRMADFVREKLRQHDGQSVVAVSHGGPIRLLEMGILGQPFTDYGYALERTPAYGCGIKVIGTAQGIKAVERVDL